MFTHSDNPLPIDIIHVLMRATHYIQREFETQLSALNMPYQITGPRLRLLSVVFKAGKIRMNELASELGIKARTVTDFVDALERDKLLIRIPDPTDRRATLLELTELAQANISQVLAFQAEIAEQLLSNFSTEQRQQFFDLLLQLIENKDISNPSAHVLK
ncbi:MarR family transcriptional regulator [Paenibacillus sp. FSL A5-0031]|uniref:MarR family winged helix-turn-helix transcriptional regulator n=1 Tax=Paenibacillus sp. FSL A5-0031 TaxID=1920420 RepID=UPI00096F5D59|nr:MarR family transcriptional regulator [Paenibacillus sp. FSL A5-0031]OME83118.1 MarR family transcriptional regulator [Paenibacillus sp. FSL A5-0031]